jgi:hypothetical protein
VHPQFQLLTQNQNKKEVKFELHLKVPKVIRDKITQVKRMSDITTSRRCKSLEPVAD